MKSLSHFVLLGLLLGICVKTPCATTSDPFSAWDIPLSSFQQFGEYLAKNDGEEAKKVEQQLKELEKNDPDFRSLTKFDAKSAGSHSPYNFNRLISQERPDVYVNASLVHTPLQDFILAACPRDLDQATELYMYLLEGKHRKRVWVSLHDSSEGPDHCNHFWYPEFVKTLPLRDGWRLIRSSAAVLSEGKNLSAKGTKTELIKTTLIFSNGREQETINHLHYNGWFDQCECPDLALFLCLLQEMESLNIQEDENILPSFVPICINCMAGIGRTGMTTVGYLCYKKILACEKTERSQMILNIPSIIYSLRKQRAYLAENPEQLIGLYVFLGQYYSQLQD